MANISDLYASASLGEIEAIYRAIHQNQRILEDIDAAPFVNTPLHNSAFAGHLEFSIEIMRLKPSFGWKLNEQRISPIHLALQNNHHNVVRRLVEINKDLIRVKGKEGFTPLHFLCESVASDEYIKLLMYFLEICPDSIKDVNVRNESALHIALINGNSSAFRELVRWLVNNVSKDAYSLESSILNWKDSVGNTILHIAALSNNQEAVDLLMRTTMVDINARNLNNQTALDLAEQAHAHPLPKFKRKFIRMLITMLFSYDGSMKHFERFRSQINEENRNAYLVVATLVVTAIYQAVLSPPGGLTQDQGGSDNNNNAPNTTDSNNLLNSTTAAGKSVLPLGYYSVISILNSYIFCIGISTIVWMMPKSARLFFFLTVLSVAFFAASYTVSELVIWPKEN